MAKQVDIEVVIGPDGQVTVHVEGAKGKACLEYQELLEQALGTVTEQKLTPEYYEDDVTVQTTQAQAQKATSRRPR